MGSDSHTVYRAPDSAPNHAGDPYTAIPLPKTTVEAVAADYDVSGTELARALRDFETDTTLLVPEALFTGFDPLPVGVDDGGHLFLRVSGTCHWDVVAEGLDLTTIGRDALAAAHDRHIDDVCSTPDDSSGTGIITSCPEFPAAALDDIHYITKYTTLANRQATLWALSHQARSPAAISSILGIPTSLVRTELAAVDRAREDAVDTLQAYAGRHWPLSFSNSEPLDGDWLGFDWSEWFPLSDRQQLLDCLPRSPGLYRVRHTQSSGLLYIGETGSDGGLRSRVGLELSDGFVDSSSSDSHGASRGIRQISDALDGRVEVSTAAPPIAANHRYRRAIEAALVAVCRRETGWTPSVQLNRTPLDDRSADDGSVSELETRSESNSYPTPSWQAWRATTSPRWMGLQWSSPRRLADRATVELPPACAVRVWSREGDAPHWGQTLTYLGTTETPASRLFSLESTYGKDSIFSIAALPDLAPRSRIRSRERSEVWYDLVGAHFLSAGCPPIDQL